MRERSIRIILTRQILELREAGSNIDEFSVSTSCYGPGNQFGSYCTPVGAHIIRAKIGAGTPCGGVFLARRFSGEIYDQALERKIPDRDWILSRILWLSGLETGKNRLGSVDTMRRYIYIHGTPETEAMGVPNSHGCIRMRNIDVIRLFEMVDIGMKVDLIP